MLVVEHEKGMNEGTIDYFGFPINLGVKGSIILCLTTQQMVKSLPKMTEESRVTIKNDGEGGVKSASKHE
jgi:hypothetical protein